MISQGKPLNKETVTKQTKIPLGMRARDWISRLVILYYLKQAIFNKKLYAKKQENLIYKQPINCP